MLECVTFCFGGDCFMARQCTLLQYEYRASLYIPKTTLEQLCSSNIRQESESVSAVNLQYNDVLVF